MRVLGLSLVLALSAGIAVAEPLSFKDAKKALPNASKRVSLETFPDRIPASDLEKFDAVGMTLKQVFKGIGATL